MTVTAAGSRVARDAMLRLLAPPGQENPYPDYAALRSSAPVYEAVFGTFSICFISAYAECQQVLASPDFGVQDAGWFDQNLTGWRDRAASRTLYQGVQSKNPPDHTRLRRVLGGCFSMRRMEQLTGLVTALTGKYLDVVADAGADGGAVDLMTTLAAPLPVAVISELLGVPESDRGEFHRIGGALFNLMDLLVSEEDRAAADDATRRLRTYWAELIADRRAAPRRDLTSDLVAAADAGQLSEEELLSTLIFLFAAGYGTTAALVCNASVELLADGQHADMLRHDPGLAPAIVEESLRHDAPTQIDPRLALADVPLGGTVIPQGRLVIALLGAGNRDPAAFPDPDRFDPGRAGTRVLSFGGGIHYCLGAPLSRLEATILLPRLVRRFPRLRLNGQPERRRSFRMQMHAHVPISIR